MPPTDSGLDASHSPRDTAAYWFARVHSGKLSAAERQVFEAWRLASPENERHYREVDQVWQVAALIPREELLALAQTGRPPAAAKRLRARRFVAAGLGLACTLASVVVLVGWLDLTGQPTYTAELTTQHGERRQVLLPDGSELELNAQTSAIVKFYDKRRLVELASGEIMFSVTPDGARPFIVDADVGTVRVTGTRFNVHRDHGEVDVAVESGAVEVSTGPWWRKADEHLAAGMGTSIRDAGLTPAAAVDVASLTAWRQGKIVFRNLALDDVVRQMNRYLPQPILLADSRLASMRLTGIFDMDNAQAFLDALPHTLPVRVGSTDDGRPFITMR